MNVQMPRSVSTMEHNKTGSWRYLRPLYQNKVPPCRTACPAGEAIPLWIDALKRGHTAEAWQIIKRDNPLPSVCGRVCYHPCETACHRAQFDEAVAINALERVVGDSAHEQGLRTEVDCDARSERIAVVGSGPAGLSAAYFAAHSGFPVTVYEAERELGGLLRWAIPAYRLPRQTLDRELQDIAGLGVRFEAETRLGQHISLASLCSDHRAVFIATGAHNSRSLGIPGEELAGVMSGLQLLKRHNLGEAVEVGRRVLVIGGGNTALDAARACLRMGAQVTVLYRRTRADMPAHPDEIVEAEREGVEFTYLSAPTRIETHRGTLRVTCPRMRPGEADPGGRREVSPIAGSEFVLSADTVVTAIGEEAQLGFLAQQPTPLESAILRVSENVFIGGDAATGPSTVVEAIASGKRAAALIEYCIQMKRRPKRLQDNDSAPAVPFDRLNLDYFARTPRADRLSLPLLQRARTFAEVDRGISWQQGPREAERCFSCGMCNTCDNCLVFCPDVAITRNDGNYEVNYDYCKGCGICAVECPRGVIDLQAEVR